MQEQMAQMEEMEQLSKREEQSLQEQLPQVARVVVVVDNKYESEVSRQDDDTRLRLGRAPSPCLAALREC